MEWTEMLRTQGQQHPGDTESRIASAIGRSVMVLAGASLQLFGSLISGEGMTKEVGKLSCLPSMPLLTNWCTQHASRH